MNQIRPKKLITEEARGYLLFALHAGRPFTVKEKLLQRTLADSEYELTELEIRQELDYLAERQLVHVEKGLVGGLEVWSAKLSHTGVDVVERTVPCHAGIVLPREM